jgi:hypothetical protein
VALAVRAREIENRCQIDDLELAAAGGGRRGGEAGEGECASFEIRLRVEGF